MTEYEPVIGLEVHAQLLTRTKAFCGCRVGFGEPPNTRTCPVCLGLPGALPVPNAAMVRLAVRAALALGCTVHTQSLFSRKNYFYPDLPKGYQISQYDQPLATSGSLEIDLSGGGRRRVGITRVHLEEDAGKTLHRPGADSRVDLNRAGTPLIEIVGAPDLRSAAEAGAYLRRLREVLMFLAVNDGNLEQGSFRCDANVSVRPRGASRLGVRTELKNINSFRFVEDAIELEVRRQIELLEAGEGVRMQTRGYDADRRETYLLREKEREAEYRYFPDPDLPPLLLDEELVAAERAAMGELPDGKRARFVEALGLGEQAASVLTSHPRIAELFEETVRQHGDARRIANWILSEVLRDTRLSGLDATFPVGATQIAELLRLVEEGAISGKQAKEVHAAMVGTTRSPRDIVRERGLAVLVDEAAIEAVVREVVAESPRQAASYRAGKRALFGYFVGEVMKRTGGRASPQIVQRLLSRVLDADKGG